MANVSPVKLPKWLQVRVDDGFLSTLDDLASQERPQMSRSDYVRKLVYDAQKRQDRKGAK